MLPESQPRKKRNSSRVNLTISLVFHGVILLALFYFAAREGLLGKQIQKITVEMVKEKPPEKPKEEKPPEKPPEEAPKPAVAAAPPKEAETPPPAATTVAAPPAYAPPTVNAAAFDFGGGKTVQTSSDPVELYRGFVEYSFRARWNRPEDIEDDQFVAEVELSIDRSGVVGNPQWKRTSGNTRWDDSVRKAVASLSSINRPPPTNFPPRFIVRFDVQSETEPLLP